MSTEPTEAAIRSVMLETMPQTLDVLRQECVAIVGNFPHTLELACRDYTKHGARSEFLFCWRPDGQKSFEQVRSSTADKLLVALRVAVAPPMFDPIEMGA